MGFFEWFGAGSEAETPRDGFLSSRAEWHSLGIGLSIGFIVALAGGKEAAWLFVVLAGIALGVSKVSVGQLKHVQKEPYYALVASVASFLLTAFLVIPNIPVR
ncbi:hypothetical protein [Halonotius roseus]|uniref:Uncharacterized protein n=1 Tax=Halonotius roseus TaxID=2511997 RepID=A0A544QQX7_9EURY|nr:hypothetical protein [Halonotius roseus]TQQ81839.1 hypothetical protein EWF95_02575 [Halonotius roseus]